MNLSPYPQAGARTLQGPLRFRRLDGKYVSFRGIHVFLNAVEQSRMGHSSLSLIFTNRFDSVGLVLILRPPT